MRRRGYLAGAASAVLAVVGGAGTASAVAGLVGTAADDGTDGGDERAGTAGTRDDAEATGNAEAVGDAETVDDAETIGDASRRGPADVDREPASTILAGTPHETPVYVVDGDADGPTALVMGGIHGDERSGFLTAERVAEWSFEAGRVVVVPRANRVAIRRGTREGDGGDLNRQFPPGEEPRTDVARALWGVVEEYDPDVLVDLHRSKGIHGFHHEFVGQTIFPSAAGDGVANAEATAARLNAAVPWYMPFHRFGIGNVADGTAPLLHHKFVGDRGRPSYIVETTTYLTDLRLRIEWTSIAAADLLARHGIERRNA